MSSRRDFLKKVGTGIISTSLLPLMNCTKSSKREKPNILLIMADDMGFSDLEFMGAKIDTPNLNKIAKNGLIYNQFYNTSRCCPTRASLLTGLYPHKAGMGWMTAADLHHPGYRGDLNENCTTIARALKQSNYSCYITGKWHVTHKKYQKPEGPKHNWPLQRGFDKYYGHLSGGGSYFSPKNMIKNNEWLDIPEDLPDDFYLTRATSRKNVQFLKDHFENQKDKPFFLYSAYYAPHRPLHALEEDIEKYRGNFMEGWDKLRRKRLEKLKEVGIADSSWDLSERNPQVPPWNELSQKEKEIWDARMAVYAAMIDRMDQGIGRMIDVLKEYNELDNTLIIFLSDNGGCHEEVYDDIKHSEIDELGGEKGPKQGYRRNWANVSNTPFRMFKHWVHEGGTSTPLLLHWPDRIKANGKIVPQVGHVVDIMQTILDVTDTSYPQKIAGNKMYPLPGKSLTPNFDGKIFDRGPIFFEHAGNRAIRKGKWKLVSKVIDNPPYIGEWELYNLAEDRSETNNLADKYPQKVKNLAKIWDNWAKENKVYPLDPRGWWDKIRHPKEELEDLEY